MKPIIYQQPTNPFLFSFSAITKPLVTIYLKIWHRSPPRQVYRQLFETGCAAGICGGDGLSRVDASFGSYVLGDDSFEIMG